MFKWGNGDLEKSFEPEVRSKIIDEELTLIDIFLILAKRAKQIIFVTFLFAAISIVISLVLSPLYEGRVVIAPAQTTSSLARILEASGLPLSLVPEVDVKGYYKAVAESRILQDRLMDKFGPPDWRKMVKPFGDKTREKLFKEFVGEISVRQDRDKGVLIISVFYKDQFGVAERANTLVREMERIMNEREAEEAGRKAMYLEKELQRARENLAQAESKLKAYQEKTGVYLGDIQLMANVEARVKLRAEVAAKEVELKTLLSFATPNHPDVVKLQRQIAALKEEIARLEKATGDRDPLNPTIGITAATLEYIELYRDFKFYETVYNALLKAYETARMNQAFEPVIIRVVDWAEVPESKAKPKRTLIVVSGAILGFILSVIGSLFAEFLKNAAMDPQNGWKVKEIRESLRLDKLLFIRRRSQGG